MPLPIDKYIDATRLMPSFLAKMRENPSYQSIRGTMKSLEHVSKIQRSWQSTFKTIDIESLMKRLSEDTTWTAQTPIFNPAVNVIADFDYLIKKKELWEYDFVARWDENKSYRELDLAENIPELEPISNLEWADSSVFNSKNPPVFTEQIADLDIGTDRPLMDSYDQYEWVKEFWQEFQVSQDILPLENIHETCLRFKDGVIQKLESEIKKVNAIRRLVYRNWLYKLYILDLRGGFRKIFHFLFKNLDDEHVLRLIKSAMCTMNFFINHNKNNNGKKRLAVVYRQGFSYGKHR